MSDKENLSLQELRANLKATIRKSGVLDTVKAQIRREFITGLSKQIGKPTLTSKEHVDLRERVVLSSVYHLLKNRNLPHSLSVYAAESGIDAKSFLLSEVDIVQALNLDNINIFNDTFIKNQSSSSSSSSSSILQSKKAINNNENITKSVVDVIIDYCCSYSKTNNTIESSSLQGTDKVNDGVGPVDILDKHLKEMRQTYVERQRKEEEEPNRTLEERMIIFQRDCEARYKRELELKLQAMKESEIIKIREELLLASQQEADAMRRNMDAEYKHLMKKYADQETTLKQEYLEREQKLERKEYEARQALQQELNSLKLKDESANRKIEYEEQGLRMLELRVKEASILIESREKEVSRREKEIEELSRGYQDKAKFEARAYLQSELDDLMREKTALKVERHRLIEESTSHAALLDSIKNSKNTVQTLHANIASKDDEIEDLKKKLQLELEKNHKLETGIHLKPEESSKLLTEKIAPKEPAAVPLRQSTPAMSQMAEVLRKELSREKAKSSALQSKCSEFEKLIQEQRNTITSLTTQIKKDITPSGRLSTSQLIDNVLKKKESNATGVRMQGRPETQPMLYQPYYAQPYPEQYAYPMPPPGVMMHPTMFPPYPVDAQMYAQRFGPPNVEATKAAPSTDTPAVKSQQIATNIEAVVQSATVISASTAAPVISNTEQIISKELAPEPIVAKIHEQSLSSQEIEENKQMLDREIFQREAEAADSIKKEKEEMETKLIQERLEKEKLQKEIELANEKKRLEEEELKQKRLEEEELEKKRLQELIIQEARNREDESKRLQDAILKAKQEEEKRIAEEQQKAKEEEERIQQLLAEERRKAEEQVRKEEKKLLEEENQRREEEERLKAQEQTKEEDNAASQKMDEASKREEEDRLEIERRKALIRERNKKKALRLNDSVSSDDDIVVKAQSQSISTIKAQNKPMNFELSQSDEDEIEVPSMSVDNNDEFNWS